ncbi:hypothetical protein [Chishuiella sp.]|uniref:hypothetical protein n=1 Tax=Chishuiella sp. TaxID=1969467 RepID=UPI0028A84E14|nr:hypothetical protein [Chishuiella sp.]
MEYTNLTVVKTQHGIEVEGNSVWRFNQHLNLMVLVGDESIRIKPNMFFERVIKLS